MYVSDFFTIVKMFLFKSVLMLELSVIFGHWHASDLAQWSYSVYYTATWQTTAGNAVNNPPVENKDPTASVQTGYNMCRLQCCSCSHKSHMFSEQSNYKGHRILWCTCWYSYFYALLCFLEFWRNKRTERKRRQSSCTATLLIRRDPVVSNLRVNTDTVALPFTTMCNVTFTHSSAL